jgi:hypothetical protein
MARTLYFRETYAKHGNISQFIENMISATITMAGTTASIPPG